MNQEKIWNLIARKLSGEASQEELKLLEDILRENPDLHYPMQTITDLWEHERHIIKQSGENAFNRHIARMKEMNMDFGTEQSKTKSKRYHVTDFFPAGKKTKNRMIVSAGIIMLIVVIAVVKI